MRFLFSLDISLSLTITFSFLEFNVSFNLGKSLGDDFSIGE